jgi:F420-0:gamma-glutamyl ligase
MVTVDNRCFGRLTVRTPWFGADDDLAAVLLGYCTQRRPGDTVVVSEKVATLLTGRSIPTGSVRVGWEARLLSRFIRTHHDTLGLSVPVKMAWVVQNVGRARVFAAAAAAALTRPFGVRGTFYRVAGDPARQIDGGSPPHADRLFPPLERAVAAEICEEMEAKLGTGVAIVDINDFGGSIRGVSKTALPERILAGVLADNPLRQKMTGTPFAIVRPS